MVDEGWISQVASIPRPTPFRFARLRATEKEGLGRACPHGIALAGYEV